MEINIKFASRHRPVILLVSFTISWWHFVLCFEIEALTEQSSRGSLVRRTDSLTLDYVALHSNQLS